MGSSSAGTSPSTPTAARKLWALILSIGELGTQVTIDESAREHDTCIALAQAAMLPRDVVDMAAEDEVTAGNLTSCRTYKYPSSANLLFPLSVHLVTFSLDVL